MLVYFLPCASTARGKAEPSQNMSLPAGWPQGIRRYLDYSEGDFELFTPSPRGDRLNPFVEPFHPLRFFRCPWNLKFGIWSSCRFLQRLGSVQDLQFFLFQLIHFIRTLLFLCQNANIKRNIQLAKSETDCCWGVIKWFLGTLKQKDAKRHL